MAAVGDEVERIFLGLNRPPLHSAVEQILQKWTQGVSDDSAQTPQGVLDLSGFLLVLPTSRSAKRLLQLLVANTGEQNIRFTPTE
jgi:hypothetical protein